MLDAEPTRAEIEAAWSALNAASIKAINGTSIGEIGRIAAANPNYSPAEIRLARSVLILRAALLTRENS